MLPLLVYFSNALKNTMAPQKNVNQWDTPLVKRTSPISIPDADLDLGTISDGSCEKDQSVPAEIVAMQHEQDRIALQAKKSAIMLAIDLSTEGPNEELLPKRRSPTCQWSTHTSRPTQSQSTPTITGQTGSGM